MAGAIVVTNVGTSACELSGPPNEVELRSAGQTLDISVHTYQSLTLDNPVTAPPVLLESKQEAQSFLLWSNWCEAGLPNLDVFVVLPDGGRPVLASPESIQGAGLAETPGCNDPIAGSTLGVFPFELSENPASPPEPQPARVLLTAPKQVLPGSTITYFVRLTNLGEVAASLDPCPIYDETLIVDGRALKPPAERRYLLNCSAIGPQIAPGAGVVLEMLYPVPADVTPGSVQLVWGMEPGGPFEAGSATGRAAIDVMAP
jgi:hypothetical protein